MYRFESCNKIDETFCSLIRELADENDVCMFVQFTIFITQKQHNAKAKMKKGGYRLEIFLSKNPLSLLLLEKAIVAARFGLAMLIFFISSLIIGF